MGKTLKTRKSASEADTLIDRKLQQLRNTRPDDFESIRQEYLKHYLPLGHEERIILENVARNAWLTRALAMVDSLIWNEEMAGLKDDPFPLAQAWINRSDVIMRVQRRSEITQKAVHEGMREWERLKALRPRVAIKPQPEPEPAEEPVDFGDTGPWIQ